MKIHDKHCRAFCRWGIWIQVMTLHVLSAWPGETSHRIIWPWVDMFVLTSPEDHQPLAPPKHTDSPAPQLCKNKSEWLAAPVNVITYQSEIMSHPPTPWAAISLERSMGVLRRDTFKFERAQTHGFCAGQTGLADVTSHCGFCHSVNPRRQRWCWAKIRSSCLHGCETKNRRYITFSPSPLT